MRVFKSIPPDALHQIREQIQAAELPTVQALEQAALLINKSADYQDALKSGLVAKLTGDDLVAFVDRLRRDRHQVDASRRPADKQAKKSALRTDQVETTSDEVLQDLFSDFMRDKTAWQNKGSAMVSLSDVAALVGSSASVLGSWLRSERLNWAPSYSALKDNIRAMFGDVQAALKTT